MSNKLHPLSPLHNMKDATKFRLEQIKHMIDYINQGHYGVITILFSEISALIDIRPKSETEHFTLIKMFRHWLFHSGVTRNKRGSRMLMEMSLDIINERKVNASDALKCNVIKNRLVEPLFNELNLFTKKYNLPHIDISSKDKKKGFLTELFTRLIFKPLSHPEDNDHNRSEGLLKHYDKMIKNIYDFEPLEFYTPKSVSENQDQIEFSKKYNRLVKRDEQKSAYYYLFRWIQIIVMDNGVILFALKGYCENKDPEKYSGIIIDTEGLFD